MDTNKIAIEAKLEAVLDNALQDVVDYHKDVDFSEVDSSNISKEEYFNKLDEFLSWVETSYGDDCWYNNLFFDVWYIKWMKKALEEIKEMKQ